MKKRITGLFLVLVMVFAMTASAFAANVSVPGGILDGHTYKAYQVFKGTQGENADTLGDAQWGSGIDSEEFLKELQSNDVTKSTFAECQTALDVAAALGKVESNSTIANEVAQIAYNHKTDIGTVLVSGENELEPGYYLIVDETTIGDEEDAVYNAALLQVTDDIEITIKTDKPSVSKKVKENSSKYEEDAGFGAGYNDVADYNIGDAVPFAFYSTAPDMSQFETYRYVFHDVMEEGLTFNNDVKVSIDGKELSNDQFTVILNPEDGCTFEVVIEDLKVLATKGQEIRVDFTATLNTKAEIGLDGNTNKVRLEYSNNPNESGVGETGKTEWDEVIVFTYELDVTKVDKEDPDCTLKNAEFKLRNADGKWVIVDENGRVTGWTDKEEEGTVLKSDKNGFFKVIGLDDGTYYLKETKAPSGYNILTKEIILKVEATTNNGQTWTTGIPKEALLALAVKVQIEDSKDITTNAGDTETGIVGVTVVNNKGSILPETGGIGTTMFYVTGGVMALGSAGMFAIKRRTAKEEKE